MVWGIVSGSLPVRSYHKWCKSHLFASQHIFVEHVVIVKQTCTQDSNNNYFCELYAHVHCQQMETKKSKCYFLSALAFFTLLLTFWTLPSLPGPGVSLNGANWVFSHISINNSYAYNTRFSLPLHTNAAHFHFICYFREIMCMIATWVPVAMRNNYIVFLEKKDKHI